MPRGSPRRSLRGQANEQAVVSLGGRTSLIGFFFLNTVAQTVLVTVLPLEAYRVLGGAREVSIAYLVAGVAGFAGRLAIPYMTQLMRRPGVLALGSGALVLACGLLMTATPLGLVPGLALSQFAFACFEVVLNLYMLDYVARGEIARFEARRIFFAAAPWTVGPWLGVYLQIEVARWLPFAIAASAAVLLLAAFLGSEVARSSPARALPPRSANPLRYVPHFFAQPRLRLAWVLAAGRSSWWAMFQIYAPIFAVKSGLGAEVGGVMVSIGLGWIWMVPLWGWVGRRFGIRRLFIWGYATAGLITLAAALAMGTPMLGAAILLLAAFAHESLDGGGNTPFLRAVHPYERSEMTTVFISYRDVSQLAPPGIFALLLAAFELPAVFIAGGVMSLVLAGFSRYLPRRF